MTFASKTFTAAAAAVALGAAIAASAAPAEAGWRHRHHGGAIAAGIIGGLALGAIAASAAPAYGYYPAYGAPVACYWVKRSFVNPYGYVVVRRERVCE